MLMELYLYLFTSKLSRRNYLRLLLHLFEWNFVIHHIRFNYGFLNKEIDFFAIDHTKNINTLNNEQIGNKLNNTFRYACFFKNENAIKDPYYARVALLAMILEAYWET